MCPSLLIYKEKQSPRGSTSYSYNRSSTHFIFHTIRKKISEWMKVDNPAFMVLRKGGWINACPQGMAYPSRRSDVSLGFVTPYFQIMASGWMSIWESIF